VRLIAVMIGGQFRSGRVGSPFSDPVIRLFTGDRDGSVKLWQQRRRCGTAIVGPSERLSTGL